MSNISMVEAKLPPGFRFHPRDEELVCDYLMKKLTHSDSSLLIDLDLNKCEPWDIPETACVGGKEWYFYAQRDRKYATGVRTNRATASGYWKATGKDRPVLRKGTLVGMRKTLVFYQGRAPKGKKTDWVMHEFRLQPSLPLPPPNYNNKISLPKEDWVLCRVFYKNREEILKGCMRSSCDDTGCSSSLPELMDSYISFEQPPPPPLAAPHHQTHLDDDDDHYEQVPCFSNLFSHHHQNQTNPNHNNNAIFNHMMTITSVNMDQPNLGATTTTTSTYGGGSASTTVLPNNSTLGSSNNASNCLDPFSCDRKVLKAVLTRLTKMEANPITHNHKASPSILPDHQATHPSQTNYFSRLSIPNLWNNY